MAKAVMEAFPKKAEMSFGTAPRLMADDRKHLRCVTTYLKSTVTRYYRKDFVAYSLYTKTSKSLFYLL